MPLRKFFLLTCMWHLCASPSVFLPSAIRKYSCLRPSGRCRVKRPFSTTFSSHFHNGSISRDSVPLRHGFFRCALAAGLLCGLTPPFRFHNGSVFRGSVCGMFISACTLAAGLLRGIAPPSRFHNGSVSRDSVPLRHGFFRCALAAGLLCGLTPPSRFHNGSVFRDSVPLRHVHFRLRPCCRSSARHCPSVPFPQRQCFPRFGAVAVPRSGRCRPKRHFSTTFSNSL